MDNVDRKILTYLSEKDTASEAAVINETFKGFGISKEEYVNRLTKLQTKDYIQYVRPFGSGAFVRITENGRHGIQSLPKKVYGYTKSHILQILTLLVASATLALAVYKIAESS